MQMEPHLSWQDGKSGSRLCMRQRRKGVDRKRDLFLLRESRGSDKADSWHGPLFSSGKLPH